MDQNSIKNKIRAHSEKKDEKIGKWDGNLHKLSIAIEIPYTPKILKTNDMKSCLQTVNQKMMEGFFLGNEKMSRFFHLIIVLDPLRRNYVAYMC